VKRDRCPRACWSGSAGVNGLRNEFNGLIFLDPEFVEFVACSVDGSAREFILMEG
jgi:hypothetical protein